MPRYEKILAEDFKASLPDFLLRDKNLEMMSAPRPFTELKADDVQIRLLGDFAITHAHMTFRTTDGVQRQGRYTDAAHPTVADVAMIGVLNPGLGEEAKAVNLLNQDAYPKFPAFVLLAVGLVALVSAGVVSGRREEAT